MGIDAKNERLFDRCVKYKNGEDDLVGIWNIKLADSIVKMDFDEILFERPLQIKITDSESKQTTMMGNLKKLFSYQSPTVAMTPPDQNLSKY